MRSKLYDFASQDAGLGTFFTSPMHKKIQSRRMMLGSQYNTSKLPSLNIANLNRSKTRIFVLLLLHLLYVSEAKL